MRIGSSAGAATRDYQERRNDRREERSWAHGPHALALHACFV
jgi:hypothetical protein